MASTFTTLLRLNKPSLGDAGWGTAVNGGFTDLADSAIAGTTSVDVTLADVTLTSLNGAADQARQMFLVATGTPGVARDVVVPATSKLYFVKNESDAVVTFKVSGQTGVAVPVGKAMALRVDGTDVVVAQDQFVDLTASGNVTVAGATTLAALTASGNVSFDGGTFVFNESGADKDARFEGDTDANLLFLDASTDQVGIGTATPTAKLQVSGGSIRLSDGQQIEWGGGFNSIEGSNASNYLRFWTNNAERMRIDASGNVGIGTTPTSALEVARGSAVAAGLSLRGNNNATAAELFVGQGSASEGFIYNRANEGLYFGTNNAERMRLTSSGELFVATTNSNLLTSDGIRFFPTGSAGASYVAFTNGGNGGTNLSLVNSNGSTTSWNAVVFQFNTTAVGSITCTPTTTAYNQSSDRRLKTAIAPAADAGTLLDAVQVVEFDWKVGGHVRYGVIAQDLHLVAPEVVTPGDSNEEVERPWGVDYSKLVPMLIKEVQSLRARVAALEAK